MMICRKCGSECPDGNIFCEACGAELDAPVLPDNIDDKGRVKKQKRVKEKRETASDLRKSDRPKREKRQITAEERAAFVKRLKGAGICLAVIAAVIVIVLIVNAVSGNDGYNAAQKIPIGRNIDFASSETELVFSKKSNNGMINNMTDFDYICISEDTVKVSGSEQPRWAIMITVNDDEIITDVEYYDFKQLKLNWKGRKMAQMLDENTLEYGMTTRNVNKTLGLKPYYIKRSSSNSFVYCYRYYFTDPYEGFDRTYNYYVEFSELDSSLTDIRYSEINYAAAILSADGGVGAPETDTAGLDDDPAGISGVGETDIADELSDEADGEEY